MSVVIKVENLSKAYQLGDIGTGTISRDLERIWAKMRGKEDPFLKIGEVNDRAVKGESDVVWSLKDINFEIQQGDAVGIIGRNGAGKSTLLKILSRVTAPTTGSAKLKGRIASLLEVGTGFHPELSGRENIFLNGAILGMRKAEIKRQFDAIVDFSGVERYVDTPVKRYSSGMYVRLAFAVAAHLESEIMIIDEVLAVGDAEFQKKCLGKMNDVSKGEGRTVLFVSHNMGAIRNLCRKTIVLDNGLIVYNGNVHDGLNTYFNSSASEQLSGYANNGLEYNGFKEIVLLDKDRKPTNEFTASGEIIISIRFNISQNKNITKLGVKVIDNEERVIFTTENFVEPFIDEKGNGNLNIVVPAHTLVPNRYSLTIGLHIPNMQWIEHLNNALWFEVLETGDDFYRYKNADIGCVYVNCKWISI